MTAHFNLAVLSNESNTNQAIHAQKLETTTVDAVPSTSTADEETYIKIPSQHNSANRDTKRVHPTGAVLPTCRREYGLVNGIPVVMKLMILGIRILLLMSQSTPTTTPTT